MLSNPLGLGSLESHCLMVMVSADSLALLLLWKLPSLSKGSGDIPNHESHQVAATLWGSLNSASDNPKYSAKLWPQDAHYDAQHCQLDRIHPELPRSQASGRVYGRFSKLD